MVVCGGGGGGAWGAPGFTALPPQPPTTAIWEKAVLYHFIHTVMLFVLAQRRPVLTGAWLSFFVGIMVFSGSLYLLAVTNVKWLGAITPVGGVSFLLGWTGLMGAAGKTER